MRGDCADVHPSVRLRQCASACGFVDRNLWTMRGWWWRQQRRPSIGRWRMRPSNVIFVNAVDDPPNATAYWTAAVRRDGVTLAISTRGEAPR